MGSPVSADSSSVALLLRIMPSAGTTSPARTRMVSPTSTSATGTPTIAAPVRLCATRGARSTRVFRSCSARDTAKSSRGDDAVLLGADELLAVEDEHGRVAAILH